MDLNGHAVDYQSINDEEEESGFQSTLKMNFHNFSFIRTFYTKFYVKIVIAFGFLVVEHGLLTTLPYFQGGIIDNLANRLPVEKSIYLGLAMLLSFLIANLFGYLREIYTINYIYYDLPKFANTVLLRKLFGLSLGQHSNVHSGQSLSVVTKGNDAVHQFLEIAVYSFLPLILQFVMVISAIFWISGLIGFIVLGVSAVFLVLQYLTNFKFYEFVKNNQKDWNTQSKFFYEILHNIKLTKLSVKENDMLTEYEESYEKIALTSRVIWKSYFKEHYTRNIFVRLGQVSALLVGVYLVSTGAKSPGAVVMLIGWMGTVFGNVGNLGSIQRLLMQHLSDIHNYHDLLEIEPAVKDIPFPVSLPVHAGKIEFRHVSFRYPEARPESGRKADRHALAKTILNDVSFVIEAGETAAIVGHSGAGKSTLINLLLRGYDPDSGMICVDDVDLREADQRSFLSKVGYVPQTVDLFDNTLGYNMTFFMSGTRTFTEAELDKVARKARIDQFYDRLGEKKFEVMLGENGVRLSGGERQRVGIARALLKEPDILIFDEATSNLDSENEAIIHDAMREALQGRTGIIIAHRLSTIKDAHKIIVMDDGRVAAIGTHDMLMDRCEVYRRLVEHQIVVVEGAY
jgi:ABC-type multidrug transport system fused ATPase/permease subunit